MAIERWETVVYWQAVWTTVTLVGLTAVGSLALDLYVVAAVLGLVAIRASVPETAATSAWRDRLTHAVVVGLLAFGAVVGRRVVAALPPELV